MNKLWAREHHLTRFGWFFPGFSVDPPLLPLLYQTWKWWKFFKIMFSSSLSRIKLSDRYQTLRTSTTHNLHRLWAFQDHLTCFHSLFLIFSFKNLQTSPNIHSKDQRTKKFQTWKKKLKNQKFRLFQNSFWIDSRISWHCFGCFSSVLESLDIILTFFSTDTRLLPLLYQVWK